MRRTSWGVVLLLFLSAPALAQTKWYRFSKAFIRSHYAAGNPIGTLAAHASSPGPVHSVSCGGNDGEVHIGVEGAAIDNQGIPFSGPADGSEEFGLVAEPPNVTPSLKNTVDSLSGQPIQFAGYFRVWNERPRCGRSSPQQPAPRA